MATSGPHLPKTQGLNATNTFQLPPLDRSLWQTIPQLFDTQAQKNPNHPAFVYNLVGGEECVITLRQYILTVHTMARNVQREVGPGKSRTVIGLLSVVDKISFATVSMSILRAGFIPFIISPHNSPQGLAYLLAESNTQFIYTSDDPKTQSLIADAFALLPNGSLPRLLDILTYSQLEILDGSATLLEPMETPDLDSVAIILHSSGSTAQISKVMKISHKVYLEWASGPYYGTVDVCGEVMSMHAIPFFHAMGPGFSAWIASIGVTVSLLRPEYPPIAATPATVLEAIVATKSTMLIAVPAFLEIWGRSEEAIKTLISCKNVLSVGAPLNKDIGDLLSRRGVILRNGYASIETGFICRLFTKAINPYDWEYFDFTPQGNFRIMPVTEREARATGVVMSDLEPAYVPLVMDCASQTVVISNTEIDGVRTFKMNDLVQRHPEIETMYKPYGRIDDQITLNTGFKIHCGPIELYVRKHHKIEYGVMFGNGKSQPGIILQLHAAFAFEPKDISPKALEAHREEVWQTVVDAIEGAQVQSEIARNMILFASPSKPFPLTPKGNPRRVVVVDAYVREINKLYEDE